MQAGALVITGLPLLLAGCMEPAPVPVYPVYPVAPYPNYGTPLPPPVPRRGERPLIPPATPDANNPIEPELPPLETGPELPPPGTPSTAPSVTPAPDTSTGGSPVTAPSSTSNTNRFESLKDRLEQSSGAATPVSTSAPAAAGCTNVHTRAGFHDHYGGLNSAGDVRPSCP